MEDIRDNEKRQSSCILRSTSHVKDADCLSPTKPDGNGRRTVGIQTSESFGGHAGYTSSAVHNYEKHNEDLYPKKPKSLTWVQQCFRQPANSASVDFSKPSNYYTGTRQNTHEDSTGKKERKQLYLDDHKFSNSKKRSHKVKTHSKTQVEAKERFLRMRARGDMDNDEENVEELEKHKNCLHIGRRRSRLDRARCMVGGYSSGSDESPQGRPRGELGSNRNINRDKFQDAYKYIQPGRKRRLTYSPPEIFTDLKTTRSPSSRSSYTHICQDDKSLLTSPHYDKKLVEEAVQKMARPVENNYLQQEACRTYPVSASSEDLKTLESIPIKSSISKSRGARTVCFSLYSEDDEPRHPSPNRDEAPQNPMKKIVAPVFFHRPSRKSRSETKTADNMITDHILDLDYLPSQVNCSVPRIRPVSPSSSQPSQVIALSKAHLETPPPFIKPTVADLNNVEELPTEDKLARAKSDSALLDTITKICSKNSNDLETAAKPQTAISHSKKIKPYVFPSFIMRPGPPARITDTKPALQCLKRRPAPSRSPPPGCTSAFSSGPVNNPKDTRLRRPSKCLSPTKSVFTASNRPSTISVRRKPSEERKTRPETAGMEMETQTDRLPVTSDGPTTKGGSKKGHGEMAVQSLVFVAVQPGNVQFQLGSITKAPKRAPTSTSQLHSGNNEYTHGTRRTRSHSLEYRRDEKHEDNRQRQGISDVRVNKDSGVPTYSTMQSPVESVRLPSKENYKEERIDPSNSNKKEAHRCSRTSSDGSKDRKSEDRGFLANLSHRQIERALFPEEEQKSQVHEDPRNRPFEAADKRSHSPMFTKPSSPKFEKRLEGSHSVKKAGFQNTVPVFCVKTEELEPKHHEIPNSSSCEPTSGLLSAEDKKLQSVTKRQRKHCKIHRRRDQTNEELLQPTVHHDGGSERDSVNTNSPRRTFENSQFDALPQKAHQSDIRSDQDSLNSKPPTVPVFDKKIENLDIGGESHQIPHPRTSLKRSNTTSQCLLTTPLRQLCRNSTRETEGGQLQQHQHHHSHQQKQQEIQKSKAVSPSVMSKEKKPEEIRFNANPESPSDTLATKKETTEDNRNLLQRHKEAPRQAITSVEITESEMIRLKLQPKIKMGCTADLDERIPKMHMLQKENNGLPKAPKIEEDVRQLSAPNPSPNLVSHEPTMQKPQEMGQEAKPEPKPNSSLSEGKKADLKKSWTPEEWKENVEEVRRLIREQRRLSGRGSLCKVEKDKCCLTKKPDVTAKKDNAEDMSNKDCKSEKTERETGKPEEGVDPRKRKSVLINSEEESIFGPEMTLMDGLQKIAQLKAGDEELTHLKIVSKPRCGPCATRRNRDRGNSNNRNAASENTVFEKLFGIDVAISEDIKLENVEKDSRAESGSLLIAELKDSTRNMSIDQMLQQGILPSRSNSQMVLTSSIEEQILIKKLRNGPCKRENREQFILENGILLQLKLEKRRKQQRIDSLERLSKLSFEEALIQAEFYRREKIRARAAGKERTNRRTLPSPLFPGITAKSDRPTNSNKRHPIEVLESEEIHPSRKDKQESENVEDIHVFIFSAEPKKPSNPKTIPIKFKSSVSKPASNEKRKINFLRSSPVPNPKPSLSEATDCLYSEIFPMRLDRLSTESDNFVSKLGKKH